MKNPHLDPVAVQAALLRMARQAQAPWLHGEVARRMAERLQLIKLKPHSILDWWSFSGAGHTLLNSTYPQAKYWIVEPNTPLEQRSKASTQKPWWSSARWTRQGSIEVLTSAQRAPTNSFQLVWANMMLHAVSEPLALFQDWHQALQVNGFVMFSCLGPATLRELRSLYRDRGWPPPSTEFIDMHDVGDMLIQAGFSDPVMDQETLTLRWQSASALLKELRTLGGNTSPHRHAGLRTPHWRQQLEQALQGLASPDGTVGLSFEVAYGHAFKAAPRARAGQDTVIPLEEMRTLVKQRKTAVPTKA